MLRYKTQAKTGLVVLYNIWPGNGMGLFLQPRSPHGAYYHRKEDQYDTFFDIVTTFVSEYL